MEKQHTSNYAKTPMTNQRIYKISIAVPVGVAFCYFIKNIIGGSLSGALTIGLSMFALVGIACIMNARKVDENRKQFIISLILPCLVFPISINSGKFYSDDFQMYLAVIGLTGLYMEPRITRISVVISDIIFALMYMIHPEKGGELVQYILCMAVFTLAGVLFSLVISRGRTFIEISNERAAEAEKLLGSMRNMGVELQNDFSNSSVKIEENTVELKDGSGSIIQGAQEASERCAEVHDKIQETEVQIEELNNEVQEFEIALTENHNNVEAMNEQIQGVSAIIGNASQIFGEMKERMNDISGMAKQLGNIAFNTTILSLNASIEAARAGNAGSGFAVVAERMRELSENSDSFSEQVADVVKEMLGQVEQTAARFYESTDALERSEITMQELRASFERLQAQFGTLYQNIEQQNQNVKQVDSIFDTLQTKVSQMHNYSVDNQGAVESIVDALDIYRENISRVIENTQQV